MRHGSLYMHRGESRTLLLDSVMRTASPWERTRGLLWRRPLDERAALLIDRCGSVHTCGMRYPLDLAFIDCDGTIRKLVHGLRPWRCAGSLSAVMTLEMKAGAIDRLRLETRMQLSWQES